MSEFEVEKANLDPNEPPVCDVCKAPIHSKPDDGKSFKNKYAKMNIKTFTDDIKKHDIIIDYVCFKCLFMVMEFMKDIERSVVSMK